MSDNGEIKFFSPILDDRAHFDGGKGQMDEMERHIKEQRETDRQKDKEYQDYLNGLLSDVPVMTAVSDEAVKKMFSENKVSEFVEFATDVARITEGELLKRDGYTDGDLVNIFKTTIDDLCDRKGKNSEHYTWLSVKILKDTWVHGEEVREWWNQKFLPGESGKNYSGVYDYRQKDRNFAYRVAPEFPGKK